MLPAYRNTFYETYKGDRFSQNGEDGVILELIKKLEINSGWVCEFGAWDGIHLSNTFNLVLQGFKAVYIEGDNTKFLDLLKTSNIVKNIVPINAFVNEENTLDSILSKTEIPTDFDILSIDIDSFDYQVWERVEKYKPKIVIIEINSSIHPHNLEHIHNEAEGKEGTGFQPMLQLGIKKGYTFFCHTGNMIFIRNDLTNILKPEYIDPIENYRRNWIN